MLGSQPQREVLGTAVSRRANTRPESREHCAPTTVSRGLGYGTQRHLALLKLAADCPVVRCRSRRVGGEKPPEDEQAGEARRRLWHWERAPRQDLADSSAVGIGAGGHSSARTLSRALPDASTDRQRGCGVLELSPRPIDRTYRLTDLQVSGFVVFCLQYTHGLHAVFRTSLRGCTRRVMGG